MSQKNFEVLIVGAGISGVALAYELARYTDIGSIGVIEKYEDIATLNSSGTSNSQILRRTIHLKKRLLPSVPRRWSKSTVCNIIIKMR